MKKLRAFLIVIALIRSHYTMDVGPGPGRFYHHGKVLLPNPSISPGLLRHDATEVEVCTSHTKEFRHTTEAMKMEVYRAYSVIPHEGICRDTIHINKEGKKHTESCEVDHVDSLELGGADVVQNLFIQPYNPPDDVPGAHAKDAVENWLHHQVCVNHTMTLQEAQREISTDWYWIYLNNHLAPEVEPNE
jgi:hypothetical protein